ncbi:MAG: DNA polymerase, partial [Clostridia bacterium]
MPRILSIDLETYSSAPLPKCGVYRYVDAPDFEILLFSYAYDDEPVQTLDMASGECLPPDVLSALGDPAYLKYAYNAAFERVCLSRLLGHWLDPMQWRCSAVMAATLTLPARLADVAVALKLTQQKMEEGKDLIRFFSIPCKPTKTNGGRTRNLPQHAPEKWETYKQYNAQDVETERAVSKALEAYPLPESEWELYALDQRINDRGVRVDRLLVKNAMAVDRVFSAQAFLRAKELTGLENPGSVSQLKAWLSDQDMPMESLAKKVVQETAKSAEGIVKELLDLRLDLSKTSIKKYEAMARCVCRDGRVHGMLQFYGANRTGRWSGRNIQLQNLPQNHLPDLSLARDIVKAGDTELIETLFGSVPSTLSELIRTAFIPKDGCRFIVADFSAIEARVLAWL